MPGSFLTRVARMLLVSGLLAGIAACDKPVYKGSVFELPQDVQQQFIAAADPRCSNVTFSRIASHEVHYTPVMKQSVFGMDPFLPGGEITCRVYSDFRAREHSITPAETGNINGVRYSFIRYEESGQGTVQGLPGGELSSIDYENSWRIECESDAMDDGHWCSISRGDLDVTLWKDGNWVILIGHQHYPRSDFSIRIDGNPAITTSSEFGFLPAQIQEIIQQLKSGDTFVTRYQKWPYRHNRDKTLSAYGFAEAVTLAEAAWQAFP